MSPSHLRTFSAAVIVVQSGKRPGAPGDHPWCAERAGCTPGLQLGSGEPVTREGSWPCTLARRLRLSGCAPAQAKSRLVAKPAVQYVASYSATAVIRPCR